MSPDEGLRLFAFYVHYGSVGPWNMHVKSDEMSDDLIFASASNHRLVIGDQSCFDRFYSCTVWSDVTNGTAARAVVLASNESKTSAQPVRESYIGSVLHWYGQIGSRSIAYSATHMVRVTDWWTTAIHNSYGNGPSRVAVCKRMLEAGGGTLSLVGVTLALLYANGYYWSPNVPLERLTE